MKYFLITCYFIVSFIQNNNVYLCEETEKRLHNTCPTVSVHLVSGENKDFDGVVETLLNRVDDSPCVGYEEDKYLLRFNISCEGARKALHGDDIEIQRKYNHTPYK